LPACSKLASDGKSDTCHVARAMLMCERDDGDSSSCLIDDTTQTQCPGDLGTSNCHSVCQPNEYAASCGAAGANIADFRPPVLSCRNPPQAPGGPEHYCCPCE
jgi:hypothetical protein